MVEKKKKPEKEKELPVAEFGFNFGGILKGVGDLVNTAMKLAEKGQELQRTGKVEVRTTKPIRGMYGVNVRIGPKGAPVLQRFGTIKPTLEPGEVEEREPLVDVFDEKDEITVTAELPGVEEKDIKTELEGRTLKISAETKGRKYLKEVELPAEVAGEPKSSYRNGVLELKLRKAK